MTMIDATKWDEFYQEMTKDLKPYDHYDDGYRDAMDNVDDWMNGNQVEAEPVVRCKDCVNWEKATVSKNGFLICPKSGMKILARKYCSDGEKRVDDGNEADN